jgi:hippurate hydrolase
MLIQRIAAGYAIVILAAAAGATETGVKELGPEVKKRTDQHFAELEKLYKHFHSHPELSLGEVQTAARLAKELKEAGFEVTEKVGGHGIVGVLKNGRGPTVMVRTDLDALPVTERTGLPYASRVQVRDKNGREVGVMHACGHDMHMTLTILIASARLFGVASTLGGTEQCQPRPAHRLLIPTLASRTLTSARAEGWTARREPMPAAFASSTSSSSPRQSLSMMA